jgi:hypothetical protein
MLHSQIRRQQYKRYAFMFVIEKSSNGSWLAAGNKETMAQLNNCESAVATQFSQKYGSSGRVRYTTQMNAVAPVHDAVHVC